MMLVTLDLSLTWIVICCDARIRYCRPVRSSSTGLARKPVCSAYKAQTNRSLVLTSAATRALRGSPCKCHNSPSKLEDFDLIFTCRDVACSQACVFIVIDSTIEVWPVPLSGIPGFRQVKSLFTVDRLFLVEGCHLKGS